MADKNINVLEVNKLYYPVTGGIERLVQQIAEGLNERFQMKVLVCQGKGKGIHEKINGVRVTRASSAGVLYSLPISLSFLWKLRKMSKSMDVIHFHVPFPLGDLACLLSGYKGKVVVSWHSDIVRQKKLMWIYKPIMRRFLKRADLIIVATQGHIEGSDYLREYKDKCRIIPYGVEPNIEKLSDKYVEQLRCCEKECIEKKVTRFLFIGRLVYYKGCDILIEAFSKVTNAKLELIGSGPMEEELKARVNELGINENVSFVGNISDAEMVNHIQQCDVLVLPSIIKSEAFGLVQLEAMAFEKAVINTRLPSGVPYVSIDKETGLTVTPGVVEELAEAMQWLVNHESERIEMGIKGRIRVKEHFTTEQMLNEIEKVYRELTVNKEK